VSRPATEPRVDARLSLRLPEPLADDLDAAYETRSVGVRAAIEYLVAEAPLEPWTHPPVGSGDLVGRRTVRTTVRLTERQVTALEAVVQQHSVADRSRAVRDGVREVLRT